jgi:murein DD-endopeptidase MepM/ murein hydrolase activator NlpD
VSAHVYLRYVLGTTKAALTVTMKHGFSRTLRSCDSRFVVLFSLLYVVALAGCAAEGTTRILSYYGDWTGVRGGTRPAPHEGIDFAASLGDPVIAATDGTIVRVFADGMCGNGIVVQHPVDEAAWRTRYCHLDETNVQQGQKVKRGDVLGKVGTTGNSMGVPHLHFELWQRHPGAESFDRINPLPSIVGCFDPAKTAAYSTREVSGERPRLVLTYPVRCAGSIK